MVMNVGDMDRSKQSRSSANGAVQLDLLLGVEQALDVVVPVWSVRMSWSMFATLSLHRCSLSAHWIS